MNIAPDVDDPTSIASNLTGDYLLIKEDNSGSVTFTATRCGWHGRRADALDVSGQDPSATYAYTLSVNGGAVCAGGPDERRDRASRRDDAGELTVVVTPADDADADLSTLQVEVTATDPSATDADGDGHGVGSHRC